MPERLGRYWEQRPSFYRFHLGRQCDAAMELLVQTCLEGKTLLPHDLELNKASNGGRGAVGSSQSARLAPCNEPQLTGTDQISSPVGRYSQSDGLGHADADQRAAEGPIPVNHNDIPRPCVWGQYLEAEAPTDVHGQWGIFGTCAGVQILSIKRVDNNEYYVAGSLDTLPLLDSYRAAETSRGAYERKHYESKRDTRTTYKVAALLDVATSLSATVEKDERDPGNSGRGICPPRPVHDQSGERGARWSRGDPSIPLSHLLGMAKAEGGWPDHDDSTTDGGPLSASSHATAVALMAISRCTAHEIASVKDVFDEKRFWRLIENTCRYLLDLDISQMSISTISMLIIALENLSTIAPDEMCRTQTPFAYCLAGFRHELSRWIRRTTSQECLRSLEALDYRSLDTRSLTDDRTLLRPVKRYQFLYYLPHLLASLAVQSSVSLRAHASNRQFSAHVVGKFVQEALHSRGEVVPGGRQRVSTVETMWVARLLQAYAVQYWHEQASVKSRLRRFFRDAWDTFMNPRVAMFFVILAVAGLATSAAYWVGSNADQFWISLIATFVASLMGSLVLGYFVSEKQRI